MSKHHGAKRDGNDVKGNRIIQPIMDSGIGVVERCSPDEGRDYNWLVNGKAILIEIKDPTQDWHYTDAEIEKQAHCAEYGVRYVTLQYPSDVAELLAEFSARACAKT